jgi:hypothetical protein
VRRCIVYFIKSITRFKYNSSPVGLYSESHTLVAPENVGLRKKQKYNTFACHTCNEVGCVFCEFAKRKLATRKDKIKIKIIKCLPLALSVSREERCEVLACFLNTNAIYLTESSPTPRVTYSRHCVDVYQFVFCNPILFAICTSTFSKLCINEYSDQ